MLDRVEHTERFLAETDTYPLGLTWLQESLLKALELLLRTDKRSLVILHIHLRNLSSSPFACILDVVADNELGLNTRMW